MPRMPHCEWLCRRWPKLFAISHSDVRVTSRARSPARMTFTFLLHLRHPPPTQQQTESQHQHLSRYHHIPNKSPQWPLFTVCTPHDPPASLFTPRRNLCNQPKHHLSIAINGITNAVFSSSDLPPVKPSAIALGTVFNHAASLAILGPIFGETYRQAQAANSKEEFFKSKEAASAAAAWGTSLVGSAVQSYGVGALINATGTLSYKGAAYLGSLIFFASSAPSVSISNSIRIGLLC